MEQLKLDQLQRESAEVVKNKPKIPLILVLENVRSLLNVGSIFRTADAFQIQKIYLCGITGTPPHRDIQKTALGATETVSWEYSPNLSTLLQDLRSQGVELVAVEQTNESVLLQDFVPNLAHTYALILGNEAEGISPEVLNYCHSAIEVPQFGSKHSLNVAVCAGVVSWHFLSYYLAHGKLATR
ncbi:MAG: TrmH family RNA methyltransferase [Cytophagales bacterium]|nr:MAG: TrmH family RNA methyltransferase [Cytophagales bacterium]TAF59601.1 MAG: TrmH family RNA methyltransferase [Cytophagales bacterium]